jgi:thioredoxin 1
MLIVDHVIWTIGALSLSLSLSLLSPSLSLPQVDVDECGESAAAAGVEAMPTFMFYRQGKKVQQLMGADPAKLTQAVVTLKK